jgi:hypothetical protein
MMVELMNTVTAEIAMESSLRPIYDACGTEL